MVVTNGIPEDDCITPTTEVEFIQCLGDRDEADADRVEAFDENEFKANPSESNRVWIAGKSIEEWLGANVGMSRCCSVCGESDCRTLEVRSHRESV